MVVRNSERILLIIPEMIVGGAQRSLAKLSIELARHSSVWIVIFNRESPIAYQCGGEILSLDVLGAKDVIGKMNSFRARVRKLRALKKELKITAAISFLEGADYINVLSKRSEKVILSIRGSKLHDETMRGRFDWLRSRILIPFLYRKASQIVAVNKGIADELTAYFNLKIPVTVIYNFYDFKKIKEESGSEKLPGLKGFYEFPVIITSGRLASEKGNAFVIKVFGVVKNVFPAMRLIIVGDGPDYSKLAKLAHSTGLNVQEKEGQNSDADIIFTGNQENVFALLNGASLYVMASSSEGFPNGLVEAMICGVPVMTADCPYGPREILAPDTSRTVLSEPEYARYGILMPMASDDEQVIGRWADALEKLVKDRAKLGHYAQQGVARAHDFSAEQTVAQWLAVINH